MNEISEECVAVFLKMQGKLLGHDEFQTAEEVREFLEEMCVAVMCANKKEVTRFFEEEGADILGMTVDEVISQSEVFPLSKGRYLVVEA